MDCPKDRTPLEIVHFHSIPIRRCPRCGGTWYEKDQLRILKDKEAHGDYCWMNLDLWKDADKFRAASTPRYTCPADNDPLTAVHYGDSNIVVDICPTCKGVWLDKREYSQIIKYLDDVLDSESVGDFLKDLREEFRAILGGHPVAELRGLAKVLYLLELRFFVQHPALMSAVQSLPRA